MILYKVSFQLLKEFTFFHKSDMINHIQLEALREMEVRERKRMEKRIKEGSPQSHKSSLFHNDINIFLSTL